MANRYWRDTSAPAGNWSTAGNWYTAVSGGSPAAAAAGSADVAFFNHVDGLYSLVYLAGNVAIQSIRTNGNGPTSVSLVGGISGTPQVNTITVNTDTSFVLAAATSLSLDANAQVLLTAPTAAYCTLNNNAYLGFGGIVSGAKKLFLSHSIDSIVDLTQANTYSGGTDISGSVGNVGWTRVGTSTVGSPGAVTSGPLGTGTITLSSGKLSSTSTAARTLANALVLNGTMTLGDATNTGALTLSGTTTFSGTTSLTTPSTVALTGAITVNSSVNATINSDGGTSGILRGATTINGTLTVNNFNLFGVHTNASAATVTINTGGTLTNGTANRLATVGPLTMAGGLLTSGNAQNVGFWTGAYILRGGVTATETSTISGFPIAVGSDTSPTGTFNVASGKTLTVSAQIDNTPNTAFTALQTTNLTKQTGTGTLTLSGANTFTGNVSVQAGTLNANSTTALGAASSTAAISVTSGATLSAGAALNYSSPGRTATISGTGVSGVDAGCLVLANAGPINLGAINATNNTYIRGTTTTQLTSAISWSGSGGLRLGAATGTTATFSGAISVSSGTLTAILFGRSNNPDLGTVVLTGANTFAAPSRVDFGTLRIGSDGNLGNPPPSATTDYLMLASDTTLATTATFTLNTNRGIALGPASGSGTGTIDVASATTLTYGGVIANNSAGAGKLTKAATGTLKLTGANTYTGGTDINAGVVQAGDIQALGTSGTVTLGASGTLQTLTTGGQNGKLTVAALNNSAGGTIRIGG